MKTILFFLILMALPKAFSQTLTLNQYLDEVAEKNLGYKAAKENTQGALLRKREADLLVLPILTLDASKVVDKKDTFTESFSGTRTEYESYKVALEQYTTIGLHAELKYEQNYRDTTLPAPTTMLPVPQYYTASPSIELTQSLWRNGFGREIQAKRAGIDASSMATRYGERFKFDSIRVESELAYLKLYYTRKTLKAIQETLGVSAKLRDWAKRRSDQELSERSDYLESKSAYESRELDLLQAQQDEKTAARFFNSYRGIDSDVVAEDLKIETLPTFHKTTYDAKKSRDDVRAVQKQLEAAKALSQEGVERGRPTLDLYASYGWYGLDENEKTAQSESFKDNYPYYTVGIRFQSPLMFGILNDIKDGYQKEVLGAQLNLQRKMQEQERDYNDLISRFETAEKKLKLSGILEQSEKQKVEAERILQRKGRTTLFKVLRFEQDYVTAQLNKIKTEYEFNSIVTQLQLYKEDL